jgi:hypothetical protein
MANAPLVEAGCAEDTTNFRFSEEIFLASGLTTKISLNPLTKLVFRRTRLARIFALRGERRGQNCN